MSQFCFYLEFLSQNSLWKLSTFHGYKEYLYWCMFGMWRVSFSQTEWIGDLASRLNWVASPSRELIEWLDWTFYPVVLHLAWLFSSFACFTRVCILWRLENREIQLQVPCWVHNLELFFIFSHTLPLHDSHLNTWFLNAELQANWHRIKQKKWLIKFNLTTLIMRIVIALS